MQKILFVILGCFFFFLLEFLLFNQFGRWFKPNLLLLFIVFVNLSFGIRYGIGAGFLAGFLRDSFGVSLLGTHMLACVASAFLTMIIRRYLFHTGPYTLRILLAFILSVLYILIVFVVNSVFKSVDPEEALAYVLLPEVLTTTLVAGTFFRYLKRCVLKFSVS